MVIALWAIRIVVALAFFVIGGLKAISRVKPGGKPGEPKVVLSVPMRILGGAEVFGALGLILPVATGIAPILTFAAIVCLGIVMVGAIITHLRLKESAALPSVLLVLLLFAALGHVVWVPLV